MTNDRSINQDDFSKEVLNFDDIKQCWKNILYTIPGTYPLLPTFGCDIWKYIDNPTSDSFGRARNVIIAALEKWEPRAKITNVKRNTVDSQIFISIMGIYTETGETIVSQIEENVNQTPDIVTDKQIMYIGSVGSLDPSEGMIKTLSSRYEGKGNQSFVYTIDNQRFCFAYPAIWGDLFSVSDTNSFEIISGFVKTNVNFTTDGVIQNYTILTFARPTTQIGFTVTFKYN